ncbi:MAG: TRAP transporter large permease [Firmicutes bacterium]|nr:TRAP transporter large permease [Bacillota bacterium]
MGPLVWLITFFILLFLTVPIGVSIGMSIIIYFLLYNTQPISFLCQNMFTACDSFPLMAIPFFIAAGALMSQGGITKRLVDLADACIGHFTGGFAMVTSVVCAFFGAISGSAPATVAAIGTIMVPAMIERGYSKGFSLALIAASGCLGVIIPPSIPMVIFGTSTGASVGDLFIAGIGPGIVFCLFLCGYSYFVCRVNGWKGNGQKFSLRRVWSAFKPAFWAILAPIIILGSIYGGVCTPTEAAAITICYSLIVGFFIYRELDIKKLLNSFKDGVLTTGTILIIVGTGTTLGRVLTVAKVPEMVVNGILGISDSPVVILLLLNVILLIVGCLMETLSAIMILGPILYPVAAAAGMDLIQFGILMVVNLAVGFCTPPVGVNLFVACGLRDDVSFTTLVKNVAPMIVVLLVVLLIITFVPGVTYLIPNLMG